MYKRDKTFLSSIPPEWRDVPIGTIVIHPSLGRGIYRGEMTGDARITWVEDDSLKPTYAAYSSLTPFKPWIPQPREVVAAWDNDGGFALLLPYVGPNVAKESRHPHKAGHTIWKNIARVPEDMLAKDFNPEASWWIANGEIYEVGDE